MRLSKSIFCITVLMLTLATACFGQSVLFKAKLTPTGYYEYSYFDKKVIVGKEFHKMEKDQLMRYLQNAVSASTAEYIAESCLKERN